MEECTSALPIIMKENLALELPHNIMQDCFLTSSSSQVYDNILATLSLPHILFDNLPLDVTGSLTHHFRNLKLACPSCNSSEYVRFRYFNNKDKSFVLQPRYQCKHGAYHDFKRGYYFTYTLRDRREGPLRRRRPLPTLKRKRNMRRKRRTNLATLLQIVRHFQNSPQGDKIHPKMDMDLPGPICTHPIDSSSHAEKVIPHEENSMIDFFPQGEEVIDDITQAYFPQKGGETSQECEPYYCLPLMTPDDDIYSCLQDVESMAKNDFFSLFDTQSELFDPAPEYVQDIEVGSKPFSMASPCNDIGFPLCV